MRFPLKHARSRRCGFCFRNVSGLLQRDGQRGVGKRIVGREGCESQGSCDRLLQAAFIPERADQAMMRIEVIGVRCERRAEILDRAGGIAVFELIHFTMTKLLGLCPFRFVHHIH